MKSLTIPNSLNQLQHAMGQAVSTPFTWDDDTPDDFILQAGEYPTDLLDAISQQGKISSIDRLGTYNRGYWFRLFTILQDEFPTLVKLIDYNDFNRLAQEYLQVFPSSSQILNYLADYFMEFMEMDHPWNNEDLKKAAELDYYYIKAFDAAQRPPLDPQALPPEEMANLTERIFYLQDHVFLYEEQKSFTDLRKTAADDEELPLDLPEDKTGQWLIFRNLVLTLECVPLTAEQWQVLKAIQSGLPFSEALDLAFESLTEEEAEAIAPHVGLWFNQWVSWGIFTLEKN